MAAYIFHVLVLILKWSAQLCVVQLIYTAVLSLSFSLMNKRCENLMFSTFSFLFWANKETIMWIFLFCLVVLVCNKLWLCFCLKQLEQCGLRTPQCTIQGSLDKPEDRMALKVRFMSIFSDSLWSWYNWIIWMMYLKECCIIY